MNDRIGRHRLLRLLGEGGMGEVFLALSEGPAGFSKLVVIKRILPRFSEQSAAVEMFLNEARLAAQMSHPNIVQVFELGEENGGYFMVMEYVHGMSLQTLQEKLETRGERLPPALVAYVCAQALQGLQHAHQLRDASGHPAPIVHRDVTPENLLVGFDGLVKVADFGVAKATGSPPTTAVGTLKGKLAYTSPEQIEGRPLDGRTDVFAMGTVLYRLLAGRPPFDGESEADILRAVLQHTPKDVRSHNPVVPSQLAAVVERALAKDPQRRFPSAEAMGTALEDHLATQPQRSGYVTLANFMRAHFPGDDLAGSHAAELAAAPAGGAPPAAETSRGSRGIVQVVLSRPPWPVFVAGAIAASAVAGGVLWYILARGTLETPEVAATAGEAGIPMQGVILRRE